MAADPHEDLDTDADLHLVRLGDRLGDRLVDRRPRPFLACGPIEQLRQIGAAGSISCAAGLLGRSYQQAWDAVDAMNNLAARPLVQRRAPRWRYRTHRGGPAA